MFNEIERLQITGGADTENHPINLLGESTGKRLINLLGKNKDERLRNLFFTLSIALTFISLNAGFYFYSAMFGLTVAIVASFTFESLRIATIYGAIRKGKVNRAVGIILYTATACVCAFAAIASFHARIIENYRKDTMETTVRQKKEIEAIKLAQGSARQKMLEKIDSEYSRCMRQHAINPGSVYWARRLEQVKGEEKEVKASYDSILAFIPTENIEEWIEQESAKQHINRTEKVDSFGKSWATSEAVSQVWKLSGLTAKKVASIIIVLSVELGILMLALLARNPADEAGTETNGRLKPIIRKFGEDAVYNFIAASRDHYSETGKLPMARDLSRRNREIRKHIVDKLSDDEMGNFLGTS